MESSISKEVHAQITELNLLFLALLEALAEPSAAGAAPAGVCGLSAAETQQLLGLDAAARLQLSAAPVALFRLPLVAAAFGDVQDSLPWMPPQSVSIRHAFALTALAGAWHVARTHPGWAGLAFGFGAAQLRALRRAPLARLPLLAGAAATGLSARFASRSRFWTVALNWAEDAAAHKLPLLAAAAFHMASAEWVDAEGSVDVRVGLGREVGRGAYAARC